MKLNSITGSPGKFGNSYKIVKRIEERMKELDPTRSSTTYSLETAISNSARDAGCASLTERTDALSRTTGRLWKGRCSMPMVSSLYLRFMP